MWRISGTKTDYSYKSTWVNMRIQGFTGVYMGAHENTGVYMGIQGFTWVYKGL